MVREALPWWYILGILFRCCTYSSCLVWNFLVVDGIAPEVFVSNLLFLICRLSVMLLFFVYLLFEFHQLVTSLCVITYCVCLNIVPHR